MPERILHLYRAKYLLRAAKCFTISISLTMDRALNDSVKISHRAKNPSLFGKTEILANFAAPKKREAK